MTEPNAVAAMGAAASAHESGDVVPASVTTVAAIVNDPAPTKVSILARSLDEARTIAGALTEVLDPPPDAVSLFEAGAVAWRVEAYFITGPADAGGVGRLLDQLLGREAPVIAMEAIPAENWVAVSQSALPPVRAGRFTVHGSHDRARIPQGPGTLEIEAGEAFGTAHHATTLGCLLAIDRLTRRRPIRTVLDLGCGSGVLALAAARALPFARVDASDVDPEAVRVARDNAIANGLGGRVRPFVADGLRHARLRAAGRYDLVVANILAGPLIAIAADMARIARPGGGIVLSGLLETQAAEVSAAYRAAGFRISAHDRIAGWATLELVFAPPIGRRSGARHPHGHAVSRR